MVELSPPEPVAAEAPSVPDDSSFTAFAINKPTASSAAADDEFYDARSKLTEDTASAAAAKNSADTPTADSSPAAAADNISKT